MPLGANPVDDEFQGMMTVAGLFDKSGLFTFRGAYSVSGVAVQTTRGRGHGG